MFGAIAQAVIALFIIIDPFLSLSVFLGLTSGLDRDAVRKQVWIAISVASGMIFLFLILGDLILKVMNISFESFKIGGGIILLILGIRTCLGKGFQNKSQYSRVSIVVIGTPMLSGPGALTTVIVMSKVYSIWVVALGAGIVLAITWAMLYYSFYLQQILSPKVMEVFSRIMGLLLCALAVQYIVDGVKLVIQNSGMV